MTYPCVIAFLQASILDYVLHSTLVAKLVMAALLGFSVFSWAILFTKWRAFRDAQVANHRFLRAFRKAPDLNTVALATEQFPSAPLVSVFDFGYGEVDRQMKSYGTLVNPVALERSLQIGASEEVAKLEKNMNWLATTASVTPFIGLFGTVLGIIDAFLGLGAAGSASLRAVGPGIAESLVATAMGLAAAIPAAIGYNYFSNAARAMGARMEDFSLEFLNLTEQRFEKEPRGLLNR